MMTTNTKLCKHWKYRRKTNSKNKNIIEINGNLISKETGEILSKSSVNTFDKENAKFLASLLENKLSLKE